MLYSKRIRSMVERMFPVPVDYDLMVTETGDSQGEARLAVKFYKNGTLIYYMDYDLEHAFEHQGEIAAPPEAAGVSGRE